MSTEAIAVQTYPHITRENIIGMRLKALRISGYDRLVGQEFTTTGIYSERDSDTATNGILPKGTFDDRGRSIDLWVAEWEPVVAEVPITFETRNLMIGKRIRVISGNDHVNAGEIHTVTGTHDYREPRDGRKVDDITVNVDPNKRNGFGWYVQQYDVVEDAYVPSVGDYVRITGWLDPSGIVDGRGNEFGHVRLIDNGVWIVETPAGNRISGPGYVFPAEQPTLTQTHVEPEPEDPKVAELNAEIERLNNRVTALQRVNTEIDAMFQQSIEIIGTRMVSEARERNWCGEFGRIVKEVNRQLPSYELIGCETEYTVDWYDVYEVRVPRSATFTASSAEDAESMAKDDDGADNYSIKDAIDNGGAEWIRGEDYEAEEE